MSTQIVVPGPKILLLGNPGDGKTTSFRTLVEGGLKVFVLFTEPGMEVLLDTRRGKASTCKDGLHFRYIPAVSPSWQDMKETADLVSNFSYQQITDMKTGFKKEKFRQFYDFIAAHADLKCDRCASNFGPPDKLEPYDQWAFVQDSLSSLSLMALRLVIGAKPGAHQGEWGEAMMNLEMYVNKFVYDIPSMAVMTAHVEKEGDEVGGGMMNMAATIGRKLAPKIPRPFSDVLLAHRVGAEFWWSNITPQYTLKSRHFQFSDRIPPNFGPAIKAWKDKIAVEAANKGANEELKAVAGR